MTTFFANQFNISDSTTTLINKAVEEVKHPYLQYILLEVQRKTKGVKAYDFHLSDSSGKMITLSDFKGKAVLLDFWYTGCHWCTVLTKEIKPFVESNVDTNIVFITISIDKNKEGWKESIKKGLYTSGNEINLYTNGMGNQHPLITYYMIHEYPNIFIINKQGKISSVQPTTISTGETAIVKLQKALNKALLENE